MHSNHKSVDVHRGINEPLISYMISIINSAHSCNPGLFSCFSLVMPVEKIVYFSPLQRCQHCRKVTIYQNTPCGVCRKEYLPPELYIHAESP